ncbi:hypothetical protein ACWEFL_20605 [Streptomyces sp. NPDC004838]
MRPDQITVTFQCEGALVTARTSGPFLQENASDNPQNQYQYGEIITPLRERGLVCTVEYGLSDYVVHAELPDGSALIISTLQESTTDRSPEVPEGWLVTRGHPEESTLHEVVYDSEPNGPNVQHGDSVPHLLSAIDARLDQLGLPPRRESGRSAQESSADAVLHRAGFVPVVLPHERFHRLPIAMTDPVEQRQTVTRAFDMLRAGGYDVSCAPELLDTGPRRRETPEMDLGDRLGRLTRAISTAAHTSETVAALSELTAPADGVLQRIVEALDETAAWWQGLGEPADPHYANRLRTIARKIDSYAFEIRSMRGELADRHTAHPLHDQAERTNPEDPTAPRVAAARSASPTARHKPPAAAPPPPPLLPTVPRPRTPYSPGR